MEWSLAAVGWCGLVLISEVAQNIYIMSHDAWDTQYPSMS